MVPKFIWAVIYFLLGVFAPSLCMAEKCLPYEPETVSISGLLSEKWGFGRPGYGEDPKHDAREHYAVLTLDKSVCVSSDDGDPVDTPEENVVAFQLVSNEHKMFSRNLVGKRVTVTGRLFHRISDGNTPVMIMYEKVEAYR